MTFPVFIEKLPADFNVVDAVERFQRDELLILFDGGAACAEASGERDARYSILTADPVDTCVLKQCRYGDDPFVTLRSWQRRLPGTSECRTDLPPFPGGIAGLMSYELGQAFERLPAPAENTFTTPALVAGLFDWAIVRDHHDQSARFFVMRVDGDDAASRKRQSDRIEWIRERLSSPSFPPMTLITETPTDSEPSTRPVERLPGVHSNFTTAGYQSSVQRVIDYIAAGDIFQANLSQQLTAPWNGTPIQLYRSVRENNAAPFCALLQTKEFALVSASPEKFLGVRDGRHVVTRPIKGTRRRHRSPIADLFTSDELSASAKDRAENVMIVDLMRNDISRVCRTGSVHVTGVCEIEVFETVQHLVSTVVGELRDDCDVWDLCAACFPGGSITGAPKIRAMEIIAELEQTARGAYCGSLFYCGPKGDFDSSILIRTFTLKGGRARFPVGGGVVADSVPAEEYEETLHKASGMMNALRRTGRRTNGDV